MNVSFEFCYGPEPLALLADQPYLCTEDSVSIESCRFYVSSLNLLNGDEIVFREQDVYHLMDASIPASLQIKLSVPSHLSFDQISFNLGIDSLTNVQGALGGNLDPTQGMYWAWQSGYINFKLEGKKTLVDGMEQDFQFHLGGYQFPFNACRKILLPLDNLSIQISMNLKQILDAIDLNTQHHIMSPGAEAMLMSNKAAHIFSVK